MNPKQLREIALGVESARAREAREIAEAQLVAERSAYAEKVAAATQIARQKMLAAANDGRFNVEIEFHDGKLAKDVCLQFKQGGWEAKVLASLSHTICDASRLQVAW